MLMAVDERLGHVVEHWLTTFEQALAGANDAALAALFTPPPTTAP